MLLPSGRAASSPHRICAWVIHKDLFKILSVIAPVKTAHAVTGDSPSKLRAKIDKRLSRIFETASAFKSPLSKLFRDFA